MLSLKVAGSWDLIEKKNHLSYKIFPTSYLSSIEKIMNNRTWHAYLGIFYHSHSKKDKIYISQKLAGDFEKIKIVL